MKTPEELATENEILRKQLREAQLRNIMRTEEFLNTLARDGEVVRDMVAEDLRAKLASLRARVKEYLAAKDAGGITDFCHARECRYWRLGKSNGPCTCGAVTKREQTTRAEAALRAEVNRG